MVLGQLDIHRWKVILTPYTIINSKCIIVLSKKHKTIKLLEQNIRENPWDLGLSDEFWYLTPKAQPITGKIDELDLTLSTLKPFSL